MLFIVSGELKLQYIRSVSVILSECLV